MMTSHALIAQLDALELDLLTMMAMPNTKVGYEAVAL